MEERSPWTDLVGRTIKVGTLPGHRPSTDLALVTGLVRVSINDGQGSAPGLQLDGWWTWRIRGDIADVETTDEEPTIFGRLRAPLTHTGPLTLADASELLTEADSAYQAAHRLIPDTAPRKIRDAVAARIPKMPPSMASAYTRGRVRRIPETGRWAADTGWAGSARALGEYDTQADAEDVVRTANEATWANLETWLTTYVHGDWTLVRVGLDIEVSDRLNNAQAAAEADVAASTWRGYVARGQAPAPDGHTNTGNPWWHRTTIQNWKRPGQGARTDLHTDSEGKI